MNNVLCLFQIICAPLFCRTNLSPPQRLLLGIHNHKVASPWGRRSRAVFFASPRHKRGLCGGNSALTKMFCGIVFTEIPQCHILEYTLPMSKVLLFFFLKLSTRILIDEHWIELITWICHFKTIETLAMERLIRSDEQLVSLLRSRRSNVLSPPRSPAIWWRHKWYKGRGSTWMVKVGLHQPWVAWI